MEKFFFGKALSGFKKLNGDKKTAGKGWIGKTVTVTRVNGDVDTNIVDLIR